MCCVIKLKLEMKQKVLYFNNKKDANKSLILWGTNLHSTVGEKLTQNELNIVMDI